MFICQRTHNLIKLKFSAKNMARSHNVSQSVLDQLTTHLVLPRYLPSNSSSEYEMILTSLMVDTLEFINKKFSIPATTLKLFHNFESMHPLTDANLISNALKDIQPGEMLGMFVLKQNCGLMVYKPQTQNLIFSTFPAKFNSSEIGDRNTDFQVNIKQTYASFNLLKLFIIFPV